MARGQIIVETSQLDTASAKVGELARNYEEQYGKLYQLVAELEAAWSGADNKAYAVQIEGFHDDFTKMKSLMDQYSQFLSDTAKKYRATQEERKNAAQKLQVNA